MHEDLAKLFLRSCLVAQTGSWIVHVSQLPSVAVVTRRPSTRRVSPKAMGGESERAIRTTCLLMLATCTHLHTRVKHQVILARSFLDHLHIKRVLALHTAIVTSKIPTQHRDEVLSRRCRTDVERLGQDARKESETSKRPMSKDLVGKPLI